MQTDAIRAWCNYRQRKSASTLSKLLLKIATMSILISVPIGTIGLSSAWLQNAMVPFATQFGFYSHCFAYGLFISLALASARGPV